MTQDMTQEQQPTKKTMSNTTTRVLVGLVGIPAVIAIVWQGGWLFFGFVQMLAVLALKELYDLSRKKSFLPNVALGYAASIALGTVAFFSAQLSPAAHTFALEAVFVLFVLVVFASELWRNQPSPLANTAVTVLGVAYLAVCMNALLGLRMFFDQPEAASVLASTISAIPTTSATTTNIATTPASLANSWGRALVMCVFAGIWICDSAAFFAGKAFGKHKLFPRVSPNKSWEGAVVGFLASALGFALLAHTFLPCVPLPHAVTLGALIGIVGQIGDLVESLLKRDAGIKDSSNIIPGHGGIFDRFDSVLFAAPLTYLYVKALLLLGWLG
jgi:phosphatidate cytidylyltransferase